MVTMGPAWDDHPWKPLPTLTGEVRADICVVGLGGAGLAAIGEALTLGATVVGLDADQVGGGASGRNGGFVLAGMAQPYHQVRAALGGERASALYRLTLREIDRMAATTPGAVDIVGSLRLASSPEEEADCDAQRAALLADGFAAEFYEGAEGRGLLFPADGAMQPLARCRLVALRLLADGARLFEHAASTSWAGDEVRTAAGRVVCDRVIVTVDGGLDRLFPGVTRKAGIRTARLQMLATAPTDEVRVPRPVYARWGYDYWQQARDGRLFVGGRRDRFVEEEWTATAQPTPGVQASLDEILRDDLGVRAPVTHRWAGCTAFSPDYLPVAIEATPGVLAVGAYSGTGNVLGPLCGQAATQVSLGVRSPLADLLWERRDGAAWVDRMRSGGRLKRAK